MTGCGVDPLKYELKWLNGVCYRVHPKVDPMSIAKNPVEFSHDAVQDDYEDEPDCTVPSGTKETSEPPTDECVATIHVPDKYLGRVCGQQHSRRKEIERETRTSIDIPEKGSNKDILIRGTDDDSVRRAHERIHNIMTMSRMRDNYTHFVSIPLTYSTVKKSIKDFQEIVLKSVSSYGITDRIFVLERKVHLTICLLSLHDKYEEAHAVETLLSCSEIVDKYLASKPIKLGIKGLEIMNDDPSKVDVVYAKVHEEGRKDAGRLQDLCDAISARFRESGYMIFNRANDREHLKLHMTVMNSKFAEEPCAVVDPQQSGKRVMYENEKAFNASLLLQKMGDFDFGSVFLERMELNVASRVEPGTGYYLQVAKLPFPTPPRK